MNRQSEKNEKEVEQSGFLEQSKSCTLDFRKRLTLTFFALKLCLILPQTSSNYTKYSYQSSTQIKTDIYYHTKWTDSYYHTFFCCSVAWEANRHHRRGASKTETTGLKWETSTYILYLEITSKSLIQSWYWACEKHSRDNSHLALLLIRNEGKTK